MKTNRDLKSNGLFKIISIIIVSYYHKDFLKKCIESINKNKGIDFEIIIVNNSPKESLYRIARNYPEIKIIEANNLGFGGGCNLGAQKASGEYLVFLNPDSIVDKYWLEETLKTLQRKDVGIVMSKIVSYDGKVINSWGGEVHYTGFSWAGGYGERNEPAQKPYEVGFASGASFFISKRLFRQLVGFDSDFFMYVEDVDLSFRARLLDKKIFCVPTSIVYHDYEFKKGDYKLFYLERNRYFFVLKNFSLKMIVLTILPMILLEVILWGYFIMIGKPTIKVRAIKDFLKNYHKTIKKRRIIQKQRKITDSQLVRYFKSKIETKVAENIALRYFFNPLFQIFWLLIKPLLK